MTPLELHQRTRRAMSYLATLPNYRLVHKGKRVELEHYGYDGYGGVYKRWEVIEVIEFWRVK